MHLHIPFVMWKRTHALDMCHANGTKESLDQAWGLYLKNTPSANNGLYTLLRIYCKVYKSLECSGGETICAVASLTSAFSYLTNKKDDNMFYQRCSPKSNSSKSLYTVTFWYICRIYRIFLHNFKSKIFLCAKTCREMCWNSGLNIVLGIFFVFHIPFCTLNWSRPRLQELCQQYMKPVTL